MTIEQKAKAYDEALERAKNLQHDNAWVTTIFPELKESEDERIRKFLLDYFGIIKSTLSDDGIWKGFQMEKILAFLKKQKEQKSLNISAASEWLRNHVCSYVNSEYNEFHKCVEYDGSIDKERLINDFEKAMQKEQKPVHTAKEMWKEMRLEVYAQASGNRHEPNYSDDSTKMFSLCDIDEIFEKIGNSIVEPQHAEWSEDDKTNGWTGVDLERYLSCLRRLGAGNPQQPETINSKWFKEHCRPQPQWKPSEEQMEALMLAIEGKWEAIKPTGYMSRRLEDLYEGLANTFGVECNLEK